MPWKRVSLFWVKDGSGHVNRAAVFMVHHGRSAPTSSHTALAALATIDWANLIQKAVFCWHLKSEESPRGERIHARLVVQPCGPLIGVARFSG